MVRMRYRVMMCATAIAVAMSAGSFRLRAANVKAVFVIAMENHNWTQPANQFTGNNQQIYQNPSAPYINSLVDGTSSISDQVAYADAYHNVLATLTGANPHIHPSEPNYIWAEAGDNFNVLSDADPYKVPGGTNQDTTLHLTTLLSQAGFTWRSYQEDIDLDHNASSQLVNLPLPENLWTVPLVSIQGNFASGFNEFNLTTQYDYAAKHNPMAFFTDSNGGNDTTNTNPLSKQYAPLQQLAIDLGSGNVADYNWITPNQFNDMHSTLVNGFQGLQGEAARIRQGDYFLSQILPMIMASDAYKNHGIIVLWWDESEPDGVTPNRDDFGHTLPFIIISKDVHRDVDGLPYVSHRNLSHSSFLRTMQEIFGVSPFLRDAANAEDVSDMFKAGSIAKLTTN
jgi:hypothetical protein